MVLCGCKSAMRCLKFRFRLLDLASHSLPVCRVDNIGSIQHAANPDIPFNRDFCKLAWTFYSDALNMKVSIYKRSAYKSEARQITVQHETIW